MKGKATIIVAVLEAAVLLTMKLMDWKEAKAHKPAASKARRAGKHRVVNPDRPEYDDQPSRGDRSAAYLPASSGPADQKIHKED